MSSLMSSLISDDAIPTRNTLISSGITSLDFCGNITWQNVHYVGERTKMNENILA